MEELYLEFLTCTTESAKYAFWRRFQRSETPGLKHYIECREKGTSASLAEQFALGATPQINGGDTVLWRGWGENQFGEGKIGNFLQDQYRVRAENDGINTVGRRYLHQLADREAVIAKGYDPRAWVADGHDIKAVCEERGWSAEGVVNVKEQV